MASNPTLWDDKNNQFSTVTYFVPPPGPITVTADGIIKSSTSLGLGLQGGPYTLNINGEVGSSGGFDGINLDSSLFLNAVSKITIGTTGEVFGFTAMDINAQANIVNNGAIHGTGYGISLGLDVNSSVTNTGTIYGGQYSIYINGTGNHTIKNSGALFGNLAAALSSGVELVTNSGTITGDISLLDFNDTLTNSGLIIGNIDMGTGNDKFTNTGSIAFGKTITMGAGDDTFIGGNSSEVVYDNGGKDSYSLGGGNDVFNAVGAGSGDAFVDTVNGGSNSGSNALPGSPIIGDLYNAGDATAAIVINLDTASHSEPAIGIQVYAASLATGTDVGTDKITNFESAIGGAGADVIFGNSGANYIDGGAAHDVLHGEAGNDFILGGAGGDYIFGDKGADILNGGSGNVGDGATDYFFYNALSDSTVAHAGRDTISFFEDGKDVIVFQGIPGHVGGNFVGVDTAFTHTPGVFEVRAISTAGGWTIQVDANGDGKADMAIDVADASHAITWTGADFLI